MAERREAAASTTRLGMAEVGDAALVAGVDEELARKALAAMREPRTFS